MGYFQDTLPKAGSIADKEFMSWNRALLASGQRLSVCVNGAECQRVVAFDVKKGWVEGHAADEEGRISHRSGFIDKYRLEGEVTVTIVKY